MIDHTKFPSIDDPLLASFVKSIEDNVQFHDENYSQFLAKVYSSWKAAYGASTDEELSNMFLSADLSDQFNSWKDQTDNTFHFPGQSIPWDTSEYSTTFSDNIEGTILDLNADYGDEIADTSPEGRSLQVSYNNVTIVDDPVYGKVMHFAANSQIASMTDLPYVMIDDFATSTDKLRLKISESLSGDTYVALVLARLGSARKWNSTDGASSTDNVMFLERTNLDPAKSLYQFGLSVDPSTSRVSFKTCPIDFDMDGATLSNRHQKYNFRLDNYANQWTLFAVELTPRGKDIFGNAEDPSNRYMEQSLAINYPISSFMTFKNRIRSVTDSDFVKVNFSEDVTGDKKDTQRTCAENTPLMRIHGKDDDFISRMKFVTVRKPVSELEDELNGFTNSNYDGTSLYFGIHSDNSGLTYLDGADIKFIKIIKMSHAYDFSRIVAREYWNSCFSPRIEATLAGHIWDTELEGKFGSSLAKEDESIEGQYVHLTSSVDIQLDGMDTDIFYKNGKKSLTVAAWVSCDNTDILSLLQSANGDFSFFMTQLPDRNIALVGKDNEKLSVQFGETYSAFSDGYINRVTLYTNEDRHDDTRNNDDSLLPFMVSNDGKWHQIVFSLQYPNTEAHGSAYDSGNMKATIYIDGRSMCEQGTHTMMTNFLISESLLNDSPDADIDKHVTFNPNSMEINLKSIEVYAGNTEDGKFLQDQDIFDLYIRDYSRYFPTENGFTFEQYVSRNDIEDMDDLIQAYKTKEFEERTFNTPYQYFSMVRDSIDFYSVVASELIMKNYSPSPSWHFTQEVSDFPIVLNGYPYSLSATLMTFDGKLSFETSGDYLIHFVVDDAISMSLIQNDIEIGISALIDEEDGWIDKSSEEDSPYTFHKILAIDVPNEGEYHVKGLFGGNKSMKINDESAILRGYRSYLMAEIAKFTASETYPTVESLTGPDVMSVYYRDNLNSFQLLRYGATYGSSGGGKTARDYVQDGLVAMWDGIENAGWGQHDASATVWADLIGSRGLTVNRGATWEADGLLASSRLAGGIAYSSAYISSAIGTIEECFDMSRDAEDNRGRAIVCNTNARSVMGMGVGAIRSRGATSVQSIPAAGRLASRWSASVSYATSASGDEIYIAGTKQSTEAAAGNWNLPNYLRIGNNTVNSTTWAIIGKCHCVRVYSRALTAAEVTHNYAIDKSRFDLPD